MQEVHAERARLGTGLHDPENKRRAHEVNKRNGTGAWDMEQQRKNSLAGVEAARRKGAGFFNPELQKLGIESQRRNGTGFHSDEVRRRGHEINRRNGTGFWDPDVRRKGQEASRSPESIRKRAVKWMETSRRRRWRRFRQDFADARATGDINEVLKVAKRENDRRRGREFQLQRDKDIPPRAEQE